MVYVRPYRAEKSQHIELPKISYLLFPLTTTVIIYNHGYTTINPSMRRRQQKMTMIWYAQRM